MDNSEIISNCRVLIAAYKTGKLGQTKMPEDSHPTFADEETRLVYFTLPMALNYQRDSYTLWESALKTYNDPETKVVFNIKESASLEEDKLREYLTRYKLALQPNKHIATWQKIARTISENWGSITNLINTTQHNFLKLKEIIQKQHKQGFPYLSGPKIFNYWSFIVQEYGKINLTNSEFIEIAPDTHVTKCSEILGVISSKEIQNISKEELSKKWRDILNKTDINPIDMHAPLWFWSRNGFQFKI